MALFQPTNIIPSTLSGKGKNIVDISDGLSVQWQINGTSALKAYQIDFYKNDTASTPVYTTGVVTPSGVVYGTDNKGNYVPFSHAGSGTWSSYGFQANTEYKLKITQFFDSITSNKLSYSNEYGTIAAGTKCYIAANGGYYLFTAPIGIVSGMTIDRINGNMLIFDYDNTTDHGLISLYATFTGTYSAGAGTQVTGSITTREIDNVVTQYSDAVFLVKRIPQLILSGDISYATGLNADYDIFHARLLDLLSLQTVVVNSVRWRLSILENGVGRVIDDTGTIYTGVLRYEYYGFVSGKIYSIRVDVELADGYMMTEQATFNVIYATEPATISLFSEACINSADGAAKLSWYPPTLATNPNQRTLYRLQNGFYKKIIIYNNGETAIKDFGVKSFTDYSYYLYYAQQTGTGIMPYQFSSQICKRFTSYYLYEATEDANEAGVYHVKNVWRFGNNYSGGSVSNGNAPQFLANFTKYPLRQGTTIAAKSGTLTALLSNVTGANEYEDTAEQMEKLYALSLSENHVFLKDTKGNLYEVHTSAPISQTINTMTRPQEVTISIPWQEIADANDAVLIQTPDDEGWSD